MPDPAHIKPGDEVVLYSDHKRIVDILFTMNKMLIRAVSGAELDLQFNRPVEAHRKLHDAFEEWLHQTGAKAEVFVAEPPAQEPKP